MTAPKHKNVRERHSCFMSVLLSKYLFEFVGVSYLVCIYLFSAKQVDEKKKCNIIHSGFIIFCVDYKIL